MKSVEIQGEQCSVLLELHDECVQWTQEPLEIFIDALRAAGYYPSELEKIRERLS